MKFRKGSFSLSGTQGELSARLDEAFREQLGKAFKHTKT